jgi:hypothetical protein
MITRTEIVKSVMMGKSALDNPNTDIDHLRFLINKMTYELSHGLIGGNIEADKLTVGLQYREIFH